VWENVEDPNDKLNMTIEFPAGSIGSAPDISSASVAGSALSIISGEVTTYADPKIIFNSNENNLDYSKELIGQQGFSDFNIFDVGGYNGSSPFTVRAPNGNNYLLKSMKARGTGGKAAQKVSGQLVANDSDDGSRLKFTLDEPLPGLTINEDGSYIFDPSDEAYQFLPTDTQIDVAANWTATDEYEAIDSSTLTITVTGSSEVTLTPITSNEDDEIVSGQVKDPDSGSNYALVEELAGLTLNADGSYTFDPSDAAYQSLTEDQKRGFFVVWKADGEGDTVINGIFSLVLTGVQDIAVLTDASVNLTEGNQIITGNGKLEIVDADAGQSSVIAQVNSEGDYGTFSIGIDGSWSYTSSGTQDSLNDSKQVTDSFQVSSLDGSKTATVTVTITGTNDAAEVSSTAVELTESDVVLNASGSLAITDLDQGEDRFAEQVDTSGDYGKFSIDSEGSWLFVSQGALNSLTEGQEVSEIFEVKSADGTATATVNVKIIGTNDKATVSSASVALNESDEVLNASGKLEFSDADEGQTGIKEQTDMAGNFGTFTIILDGNWSYTGNEEAISRIAKDQVVEDSFNVVSSDNSTTAPIKIEITGENDAPVAVPANTEAYAGTGLPSDGSTSFDLLWINEEDPSETISMNMKFAQDTLSNPPDIGFEGLLGSVLTINYQGETTIHNQPKIIFRAQENLDYSKELIGQPGFGPEEGGDFNLFSIEGVEGMFDGASRFKVRAPDGSRYILLSMKPVQSSGVSGQLVANDVDNNARLKFSLDEPILGLTLNEDGSYFFDGSDEVYKLLWEGKSVELIAEWTVTDEHGSSDSSTLAITVKGTGEKPADSGPPVIAIIGDAELFLEASLEGSYTDSGATCQDGIDGNISESVEVSGDVVNLSKPGSYVIKYNCQDLSGNKAVEVTRTVIVQDTLPPVITLNGSAEVTVEAGTAYSDAGVSASDSFDDAPIVEVVNGVKAGDLGQYIVSYTVKDSSGNKSTQQRTVNVVDTLPPVITLNGSAEVTVEAGTAYSDAGVSASDSFDDAPIVEVVNGVKTGELGQYIVSYTVKDSSGNKSTQQRTVNVVDTLPPEITLNGSAGVTIEAGTAYADAGATAKDTLDGNVAVIVNNTVNTNEPGAYTVEYSAKDEAGNSDSAIRTVLVVDNTPPEIVLVGSATETIEATLEGNYVDDGATCQDGIEGNISQNVEVSGDVVNLSKPGSYVIRYKCQDSAGNQADQVTRTVIVQDTLPPEITMNGSTEVTIEAGTVYADAGATAKDTLDGNVAVIVNNTVNTNEPGAYTVEYSAKDEAGNSVTTSRQVNVTGITAAPKIVSVVANKEQRKIKSLAITFNSSSGESYHLMHSKDLVNWDILLEVNGDKDFTEVVIEDLVSDNKSMFYKVKLLQK
jgi:VCBS repeat-containing protein